MNALSKKVLGVLDRALSPGAKPKAVLPTADQMTVADLFTECDGRFIYRPKVKFSGSAGFALNRLLGELAGPDAATEALEAAGLRSCAEFAAIPVLASVVASELTRRGATAGAVPIGKAPVAGAPPAKPTTPPPAVPRPAPSSAKPAMPAGPDKRLQAVAQILGVAGADPAAVKKHAWQNHISLPGFDLDGEAESAGWWRPEKLTGIPGATRGFQQQQIDKFFKGK